MTASVRKSLARLSVCWLRSRLDPLYEIDFVERPIGGAAIKQSGTPLPEATLDACLASDAVLLGAVGSPEFDSLPPQQRPEAGLLQLRQALGGYANLRPAISYDAIAGASPCVRKLPPAPIF